MTSSKRQRLKVVFKKDSIADIDVFLLALDVIKSVKNEGEFKRNNVPISIESLKSEILNRGRWPGDISVDGVGMRFGIVSGFGYGFLNVEELVSGLEHQWDFWVDAYSLHEGFIQAWVSDVEYEFWQNATDPLEYESAGIDWSGLPSRSNGLPFPLEGIEIDTSKNPGRVVFRDGYIEAVAAIMWFGDLFWKMVGLERKRIVLESCNGKLMIRNRVLKIVFHDCPFSDDETTELQCDIRRIIYG